MMQPVRSVFWHWLQMYVATPGIGHVRKNVHFKKSVINLCCFYIQLIRYNNVVTSTLTIHINAGLAPSGKSQGTSSLSQSQGKVREFCCKWGNFVICYQSQGKVRNFVCGPYQCIFFIIWRMILKRGQNKKLCPQSSIICQMIFSRLYLFWCFA